jgi:(2Fe-2S) ferredoxin
MKNSFNMKLPCCQSKLLKLHRVRKVHFFLSLWAKKVIIMKRFEKHIFICENRRPPENPKGCCFDKGGSKIREVFKKRLAELGLKSEVRVNSSGCLDACEFGVSVVVYPEQIWYGGVKVGDVEEIIQSHIIKNTPVQRLIIKHSNNNKDVKI